MPSEQNTDREALGDIIDDWFTDPDHIDTGFLADAILSSQWLADLIRREHAEAWAEGFEVGYNDQRFRDTTKQDEPYTPSVDRETATAAEVREYYVNGVPIDTWLESRAEYEERFDRWLAQVRREAAATQREKDMALVRWLANARRRYQHTPDKQITPSSIDYPIYLQVKSVEQVADMIEGTNDACGWLHSADWDTWAAIREQGTE